MLLSGYGSASDDGDDDGDSQVVLGSGLKRKQMSSGPVTFTMKVKRPIQQSTKEEDESEPAFKKLKFGTTLSSLLPAPKNALNSSGLNTPVSSSSKPLSLAPSIQLAPSINLAPVVSEESPKEGEDGDVKIESADDGEEEGVAPPQPATAETQPEANVVTASAEADDVLGPQVGPSMPTDVEYEAYPEAAPLPMASSMAAAQHAVSELPAATTPLTEWAQKDAMNQSNIMEISAAKLHGAGSFTPTEKSRMERMTKLASRIRPDASSTRTGHISKLVYQAEEMELVAEEMKARRKLMKAETRAKYGW